MYVCMYKCLYVCMYEVYIWSVSMNMYLQLIGRIYTYICFHLYICMCVCMYVCMYTIKTLSLCMYVCMYERMCNVQIHIQCDASVVLDTLISCIHTLWTVLRGHFAEWCVR